MEKEKSPTRRSGAAQTGLFCVRVLLATGGTLRVFDSADLTCRKRPDRPDMQKKLHNTQGDG